MKQSLENNSSAYFIYLKEFLVDYFDKNSFEFQCDISKNIIRDNKFNKSVSLTNSDIEQNLRIEESLFPEYLYLLSLNKEAQTIRNRIGAVTSELKNKVAFNPNLFSFKMKRLFEIILFKDFYKNGWVSAWNKEKCYVIKINDEIQYFTIYDYPKLLDNLLDWLNICCEERIGNVNTTYKLIIKFNV